VTTPVSGRLWQSFQTHVDRSPDAIAIETTEGQLTFGEIANAAEKIRDSLANQGIGSGDIVHVALPNIPAFLPAVLASWQLGVTVGLVSSKYRDAEFRALASRVPPKAYITTRQLTRVLERSIDADSGHPVEDSGLGTQDLNIVLGTAPSSDGILDREGKSRLALVKFTSGSTGAPKGVGLTEANLIAEGTNIVNTLGIARTDRIHVPVPVSHSYGFDLGLLPVILAGASSLLRRSFVPREILQDLASPGTTVFLGVPSMYRVLAETDPAEVPDLSHVRYFLSCTAPLMPDLIHRCNERLRISVCQHYGSSESGAIATHRPAEVQRLPSSVGKAMAGVQVRIAGPQGDEMPVGTEGEIVVRSAAVSPGYVTQELPSSQGAVPQLE
jgi:long-chain acyl-CoA synthetase